MDGYVYCLTILCLLLSINITRHWKHELFSFLRETFYHFIILFTPNENIIIQAQVSFPCVPFIHFQRRSFDGSVASVHRHKNYILGKERWWLMLSQPSASEPHLLYGYNANVLQKKATKVILWQKMNILHFMNRPPIYVAYSNRMQRRRWSQLREWRHAANLKFESVSVNRKFSISIMFTLQLV